MSIGQAFNEMMKNSEKANPIKEGDYVGKDGLWYCGKCNTRKQSTVTVLGKTYKPFCTCACEEERLNDEEEKRKQREFAEKVKDYAQCLNEGEKAFIESMIKPME